MATTTVYNNRRGWRRDQAAKVAATTDYDAEQTALMGAPGVDFITDLPRDAGQLWRLRVHDMDEEDMRDYRCIANHLNLPWERGVRCYYVTAHKHNKLVAALEDAGFIVAFASSRPEST